MNTVTLTGRLTKDVELRTTPKTGTATANVTLAVERIRKTEGGQNADFIAVQVWGQSAEFLSKYARKGTRVGVSGRIQTRTYQNQQGATVYVTEVVAEHVEILESRNSNAGQAEAKPQENADRGSTDLEIDDDELPFM